MELTQQEQDFILALRQQKQDEMGLLAISQNEEDSMYIRHIKFTYKNGKAMMHTHKKSITSSYGFFNYDFDKKQAQEVVDYLNKFIERG